jgi:hypothetical protein
MSKRAVSMIVRVRRATLVIAVGVAIAACARVPTGPSVMVLAGSGKPLEQFQADDRACRQSAAQEIGQPGYTSQSSAGSPAPAPRH